MKNNIYNIYIYVCAHICFDFFGPGELRHSFFEFNSDTLDIIWALNSGILDINRCNTNELKS